MNVVLLRHHPGTTCIVSLGIPARTIAIAAPELIEWVSLRLALSPKSPTPVSIIAVELLVNCFG